MRLIPFFPFLLSLCLSTYFLILWPSFTCSYVHPIHCAHENWRDGKKFPEISPAICPGFSLRKFCTPCRKRIQKWIRQLDGARRRENIVIDAGSGDKSGGESATNDESAVIVERYYTVSSITSNISMRRPLLPPEVTAMIVNHWTRLPWPARFLLPNVPLINVTSDSRAYM